MAEEPVPDEVRQGFIPQVSTSHTATVHRNSLYWIEENNKIQHVVLHLVKNGLSLTEIWKLGSAQE